MSAFYMCSRVAAGSVREGPPKSEVGHWHWVEGVEQPWTSHSLRSGRSWCLRQVEIIIPYILGALIFTHCSPVYYISPSSW